jgi:hypothetical protein
MNQITAPLASVFVNPTQTVPGADLMPIKGSVLIGKGDAKTAPPVDFDLETRPAGVAPDVGAYQTGAVADAGADGGAGHWPLGEGFKGSTAMGAIPDAGGPGAGEGGAGGASSSAAPSTPSSGCSCRVEEGEDGLGGLASLAIAAFGLAAMSSSARSRRLAARRKQSCR